MKKVETKGYIERPFWAEVLVLVLVVVTVIVSYSFLVAVTA